MWPLNGLPGPHAGNPPDNRKKHLPRLKLQSISVERFAG